MQLEGSERRALFTSILALFMGFSTVSFFGATAPIIKEGMNLTPEEVGLLVAIPALTGGLLRIPAATWADINGGKKPTIIIFLITLAGLLLFSLLAIHYPSGNIPKSYYPTLLILGAFVGAGVGIFTVGIAHVTYWCDKSRQGLMLGIYSGVGGVAGGLTTAIIPFGISIVGFVGIYIAWCVFALVGTVVYIIFARNPYYFQLQSYGYNKTDSKRIALEKGQSIFPKGNMKDNMKLAIKNYRTWGLSFIYFATFGGSVGLNIWLPTFYTAHYGLSLKTAGLLAGVSVVLSPIARIFSGFLSDRFSGERVLFIAIIISLTSSIFMIFTTTPSTAFMSTTLMIIGIGLANGAVFKLVPIYISGAVGAASGVIGGIGSLGGFFIPPILGKIVTIMGDSGYTKGFAIFIIIYFLALVSTLISTRKQI